MTATNRPDPSFAVVAIDLFRANSIYEAAQLCAAGVQHYPDYIGGYILLASAYEMLGQHDDAELIRTALHQRFPDLTKIKSYVEEQHPSEMTEEQDLVAEAMDDVQPTIAEYYVEAEVLPEEPETFDIIAEHLVEEEVDEEPELVTAPASHPNVLRIIEMAPVSTDTRIIRSASVRLIPGLEFTSLRFEGTRSRGRREIMSLLDPPAFRTFHQMRRTTRPSESGESRKKPVTLEELAARLNDARMPRTTVVETESSREDLSMQQSPIMITETIARIYMQQGSFELAIEAFKALQKQKPEKHDDFEKLIKECERKRS